MWAQGLTVGVMVGAGVLTHTQRQRRFEERVSRPQILGPEFAV